jgi:hypothetical protein
MSSNMTSDTDRSVKKGSFLRAVGYGKNTLFSISYRVILRIVAITSNLFLKGFDTKTLPLESVSKLSWPALK